jgi:hypothetical protein
LRTLDRLSNHGDPARSWIERTGSFRTVSFESRSGDLRVVAVCLPSVCFGGVRSVRLSRCADHVAFRSSADARGLLLGTHRSFQGQPRFLLSASGRVESRARRSRRRCGGFERGNGRFVRRDGNSVSGLSGCGFLARSAQLGRRVDAHALVVVAHGAPPQPALTLVVEFAPKSTPSALLSVPLCGRHPVFLGRPSLGDVAGLSRTVTRPYSVGVPSRLAEC